MAVTLVRVEGEPKRSACPRANAPPRQGDGDDPSRSIQAGAEPGGFIMIHGMKDGFGFIGRLHALVDWTDGCIAVTNRKIEEISRVVAAGPPIRIEP